MQNIDLFGLLLGWVFSLNAQVSARVSQLPNGSNRITIRNNGRVPLAAYAIAATVRSSGRPQVEVYTDLTVAPISRNQEVTETISIWCRDAGEFAAPVAIRNVKETKHLCGLEQPRIGAIFANGWTSGDPVLLTRMLVRRSSTLRALETTLNKLSNAGRLSASRELLIREFKRLADSKNPWYLFSEQESGRDIYQDMVGKLTNLSKSRPSSSFLSSSFLAEQSALLRQQRSALLQSQPLWTARR